MVLFPSVMFLCLFNSLKYVTERLAIPSTKLSLPVDKQGVIINPLKFYLIVHLTKTPQDLYCNQTILIVSI